MKTELAWNKNSSLSETDTVSGTHVLIGKGMVRDSISLGRTERLLDHKD